MKFQTEATVPQTNNSLKTMPYYIPLHNFTNYTILPNFTKFYPSLLALPHFTQPYPTEPPLSASGLKLAIYSKSCITAQIH